MLSHLVVFPFYGIFSHVGAVGFPIYEVFPQYGTRCTRLNRRVGVLRTVVSYARVYKTALSHLIPIWMIWSFNQ